MKQLEILIKRADSFYKKLPKIGGSEDSWNAAGTQVDFKSTPEELQRYVATQMPRSSVQPAAGNEAAPVSAGGPASGIPDREGWLSYYPRLGYDTAIPYMNMLWALDSAEAMNLPIAGTKWTANSGYAWPVFGKGYSAQVYPEYFRHGAYSPGKLATGLNSVFFPLLAADHARRMADPEASTAQRVVDGGMIAANVAGTAGTAANALQYGRWAWAPKVMGASGALNVADMAIQHYTDQINNGNAALDAYGKAKEQAGGARRSARPSSEWTGRGKNPAEATAEMEQWAHKNRAATVNDVPGDTDRTDYDTTHMFGRDMMPSFQQGVPIGGTAWFGHTPIDPVRAKNLRLRQRELDNMADEAIQSYAPGETIQVSAYPTGSQVTLPAAEYIDRYRNALKEEQWADMQTTGHGWLGNSLENGGVAPAGEGGVLEVAADPIVTDPYYKILRQLPGMPGDFPANPDVDRRIDPLYPAWEYLKKERAAARAAAAKAEREEQAEKEYWDNMAEALKDHWF